MLTPNLLSFRARKVAAECEMSDLDLCPVHHVLECGTVGVWEDGEALAVVDICHAAGCVCGWFNSGPDRFYGN